MTSSVEVILSQGVNILAHSALFAEDGPIIGQYATLVVAADELKVKRRLLKCQTTARLVLSREKGNFSGTDSVFAAVFVVVVELIPYEARFFRKPIQSLRGRRRCEADGARRRKRRIRRDPG